MVRRGTNFAAAAYLVADQWSGFSEEDIVSVAVKCDLISSVGLA